MACSRLTIADSKTQSSDAAATLRSDRRSRYDAPDARPLRPQARRLILVALVAITDDLARPTTSRRGSVATTSPKEQLDALRLVHGTILDDYVFVRDGEQLMYDAIEGMVESLDRYCRFVPPSEVQKFEEDEITGTYEGIGVHPAPVEDRFFVNWPFPGGPADRAGLRVGDELVRADGHELESMRDAIQRLLGPAGSRVTVGIRRGEEELEIEIERGSVRKEPIRWARVLDAERRIGYLHVVEFQRGMVDAFDAAVERLEQEAGGELGGIVVDLRSNPGGLLTEAVELANRFLESGLIVSLKRRDGEVVESHTAQLAKCTLPKTPTVVLIDRNSASASEVFAAALQDHERANLVGERTYGKGVVQQIYQWPNRSFRLKMTSSHYYTPKGRNISKSLRRDDDQSDPGGIDPAVVVPLSREDGLETKSRLGRYEPPAALLPEIERLAEQHGYEVPRGAPDDDPCLVAALEALGENK